MRPKGALRRNEINEFITRLYDGDLHAKRVLSLANGTLGVLSSASLAVHAVGQGLAQGMLGRHAVKQVDRLLSNDGVVMEEFFAHWAPHMAGSRPEVLVALDWTGFARGGSLSLQAHPRPRRLRDRRRGAGTGPAACAWLRGDRGAMDFRREILTKWKSVSVSHGPAYQGRLPGQVLKEPLAAAGVLARAAAVFPVRVPTPSTVPVDGVTVERLILAEQSMQNRN